MKELRPSQISMIELFSKDSFQPLTIITKRSILDVAAALDRLCDGVLNTLLTRRNHSFLKSDYFSFVGN